MRIAAVLCIFIIYDAVNCENCIIMNCDVKGKGFDDYVARLCADCSRFESEICYVDNLFSAINMQVRWNLKNQQCKDFVQVDIKESVKNEEYSFHCDPRLQRNFRSSILFCRSRAPATCNNPRNRTVPCNVSTCTPFQYTPETEGIKMFEADWFPDKIECAAKLEIKQRDSFQNDDHGVDVGVDGEGIHVDHH